MPQRRPPRVRQDETLTRCRFVRVWHENQRGLRRAQGLEAAQPRRPCGGALHGRAADAPSWGCAGAVRGRKFKTTTSRTPRRRGRRISVARQFAAGRPNELWVADLTYVATWRGFAYVAFVIDVFSRRIVGWRVSNSLRSDLALDALEQALYDRQPDGAERLVHHWTGGRNIYRFATPSAWPRRASSRPSAAAAIRTTTRWPNRVIGLLQNGSDSPARAVEGNR